MLKAKNVTSQLNLFSQFAKHWQAMLGKTLLLLSPTGQILSDSQSNDSSIIENIDFFGQFSPKKVVLVEYRDNGTLLVAPFGLGETPLGYLVALDSTVSDEPLLTWVAEMMSARLTDTELLQDMTDELIVAWNQLELIYQVTQGLALTSELLPALKIILNKINKVINAEDSFIIVRQKDITECITLQKDSDQYYLDNVLHNSLIAQDDVVLCNNHESCRYFWSTVPDFVNNLLATTLEIAEKNTQATLGLINRIGQDFTTGDMKLLGALSSQVGLVIKNFIIHQRLLRNERLTREREIAAQIQESLHPNLPQVGGVSLSVSSIPASEVGGDFYDFIIVDDQHLTLLIGDVSVKGLPAATLTTVIRTVLRSEINHGEPPHTVIENANGFLQHDLNQAEAFVTVLIVTIDTHKGKLSYASAGHMPGLLWRNETRELEQLRATAPPIGIQGYNGHPTQTVELYPSDTLVLFTDGITKAQSPNEELFGLNRLSNVIERKANEPPEQLQRHIQAEVAKFRRNPSLINQDDTTLLVVKMLPQSSSGSSKDISTIVRTSDYIYPADTSYLMDMSKQITNTCREIPILSPGPNADDFINLVELAASEICTNIIRHAYKHTPGDIKVEITLLSNGIQLDFYDTGISFDPNAVPIPQADKPTEGGYGLHIIRQIMDIVSYQHHTETGNHWHLLKLVDPS
ncbi:serine/threonine-protein phosphatase [Anaerolineales bacterium HSG24]|nr:serine/threonine-protein phosphatase [Anaerolineales bacterium HSG24]